MKIDFVVPWVDGSDLQWQEEYSRYSNVPISPERYRDWGVFKYWFRAVEKYAPWVNKVHLITCGQVPDWLNTECPKLNLVFHEDYIPYEWLPTFSSHPIELNMHRIPDLCEHFVYFNDDMYLCAPCREGDFFKKGLPCDSAIQTFYVPNEFWRAPENDILVINKHFAKPYVIKRNVCGWFNIKYGRRAFYNLYCAPIKWFPGLHIHHLPQAYLKSTLQDVWTREANTLEKTCGNRFREQTDVSQNVFRFWQLCKGDFKPRCATIGGCYNPGGDKNCVEKWFKKQSKKFVCINDGEGDFDIDYEMKFLQELFANVFPEKSSFEK